MAESMRCEFVYIGSVPPSVRRRYRAVLDRIDFVESAPRRVVLERMADGHVLFHPSPSESVGMVLLEAAASAMAIVCSEGRDLAHLHELVPKGGVLSVNRDRGRRRDYETAFTHHLQHLIRNPPQARRMGWLNYRVARSGPISIERRNGVLEAIYEDAGGENRTRPLTLREIRHARGSVTSTMSETRLERLIASAQPDPWRLGLRVFF